MDADLICYQTMPVWDKATIPASVLSPHNTQAGTYGKLHVLRGRLKFYELQENGAVSAEHILQPESGIWTIYPQAWHKVEPLDDDFAIQMEFHCEKADYFHKKYGMTATHSAVREAVRVVPPGKTLDLGCGQGRNALFLSLAGYDVHAVDHNPSAVASVLDMAAHEQLPLRADVYDINAAALGEDYDFIFATVVFMFLRADRVPDIIADMQAHTRLGGCNLIVSAMDTADHPCHMPFSFTFKEGELQQYYAGWDLLKYEEAAGAMHATDAQGRPIQLKFVTMLARKPAGTSGI